MILTGHLDWKDYFDSKYYPGIESYKNDRLRTLVYSNGCLDRNAQRIQHQQSILAERKSVN